MQLNLLNLLQQLLLPLALAVLVAVVAGLLLLAARRPGRKQGTPAHSPAARRAPGVAATAAGQPAHTVHPATAPTAADIPDTEPNPTDLQPATAASRATAALPAQPKAAASAARRPRRADLLLVDDSAVVRAKLRRLFEPAGYSIALAPDGEAALTLLGQGSYGLLLTDLEMPRLDGVGLVRAALADPGCAGMPILAITGHEDLQAQLNQLQAVSGIHRKPWNDDDLLHHVQSLVEPSLHAAEAEPV